MGEKAFWELDVMDNVMLIAPFLEEEIKGAVQECGGDKSPGPDGYNFNFIKLFQDSLKETFVRFYVIFMLMEKSLEEQMHHSSLLFPKMRTSEV